MQFERPNYPQQTCRLKHFLKLFKDSGVVPCVFRCSSACELIFDKLLLKNASHSCNAFATLLLDYKWVNHLGSLLGFSFQSRAVGLFIPWWEEQHKELRSSPVQEARGVTFHFFFWLSRCFSCTLGCRCWWRPSLLSLGEREVTATHFIPVPHTERQTNVDNRSSQFSSEENHSSKRSNWKPT